MMLSQKSMKEELEVAWGLSNDASDRHKKVEAQKSSKSEMKVCFEMHSLSADLFNNIWDCV